MTPTATTADTSPETRPSYTVEELRWWVHLLRKRATMRTSSTKRTRDLRDADNYQLQLDMILARESNP